MIISIVISALAHQRHSDSYSRTSELLPTRVVTLFGTHQYVLYVSYKHAKGTFEGQLLGMLVGMDEGTAEGTDGGQQTCAAAACHSTRPAAARHRAGTRYHQRMKTE